MKNLIIFLLCIAVFTTTGNGQSYPGSVVVDNDNNANGTAGGGAFQDALKFGGFYNGEQISSNRTGSINQLGMDFFTNFVRRLSISNSGHINMGALAGLNTSANLEIQATGSNIGLRVFPFAGDLSRKVEITGPFGHPGLNFAKTGSNGFYNNMNMRYSGDAMEIIMSGQPAGMGVRFLNNGIVDIGSSGCVTATGSSNPNLKLAVNGDVAVNRLGIGVCTPTAALHVSGNVRFDAVTQDNTLTRMLVTDATGNVRWRDAATLGGGGTGLWTANGNHIYNNNAANVGVGISTPAAKLDCYTNSVQTALQAINAKTTTTAIGMYGKANATTGMGYAGFFEGSNTGVGANAEADLDLLTGAQAGSSIFDLKGVEAYANDFGSKNQRWSIGVKSQAFTSSINGTAIGFYGYAANAANSNNEWAVYADGKVFAPGGYWRSSDATLKTNVTNISNALDIINRLEAKIYEYRKDGKYAGANLPGGINYGFLAQDLEKLIPEAVTEVPILFHDKAGKETTSENYKAVDYSILIPFLVQAIKEQQLQIEELKALVATEKNNSRTTVAQQKAQSPVTASLSQNRPNPLTGITYIDYYLPDNSGKSFLKITDHAGKTIRAITISNTGYGQLSVDCTGMAASTYYYSLVVDNVTIATKPMVVTR